MELPIRQLNSEILRDLNAVLESRYPMFTDFLNVMIRSGVYTAVDHNGIRLSAEEAEKIIRG